MARLINQQVYVWRPVDHAREISVHTYAEIMCISRSTTPKSTWRSQQTRCPLRKCCPKTRHTHRYVYIYIYIHVCVFSIIIIDYLILQTATWKKLRSHVKSFRFHGSYEVVPPNSKLLCVLNQETVGVAPLVVIPRPHKESLYVFSGLSIGRDQIALL